MRRLAPAILVGGLFLAAAAVATAGNRGIPHVLGDKDTTSILPVGDVDTFVFDAPAGGSLSVKVKAAKGVSLLPTLAFVRPDGSPVDGAAMTAAKYAPGKSSVQVKSLPLEQTGKWAVKVSNLGPNQSGEFTLQTKLKYPKTVKVKEVVIPMGGKLEVPFPAAAGTKFTLKLKRKSGGTGLSAPSMLQPSGAALSVPVTVWAVSDKGIAAKNVDIPSGYGDYTLRIPGPTTGGDAVVDYSYKVAWPKRKSLSRTIPSAEPIIDSVFPSSGNQGTAMQILGKNFQEGVAFEVGASPATSVVRNLPGTQVTGVAPSGTGTVSLTVLNPDGQETTFPGAFTYIPPPTVTGIEPTSGPATGGTFVTITGTNFRAGERVFFGTRQVSSVTVVNSTTLTLTTEPLPTGLYGVEVRDPGGASAVLPGAFTFTRLMTRKAGAFPGTLDQDALPRIALLGDLDKDAFGADDLFLANSDLVSDGAGGYLPSTRILRGNNNLTFTELTNGTFPGPFFPTIPSTLGSGVSNLDFGLADAMALGDLDGDGDQDLVLAANGYFQTSNILYFQCGGYAVPSTVDPTGVYTLRYPGTRILLNTGGSAFTGTSLMYDTTNGFSMAMPVLTQGVMAGEFFQARAVGLGDLDNDGDLDLVLSGSGTIVGKQLLSDCSVQTIVQPAIRALLNDGTGKFAFSADFVVSGWNPPEPGGEAFQARALAVVDINSDLKRDIILLDDAAPLDGETPLFALRILRNTGIALIPDPDLLPLATGIDDGRGKALLVTDLTGDGKPDIVIATPDPLDYIDPENGAPASKSSTRIYRNDGSGTFSEITGSALPAITGQERWQADALASGDLNQDGKPDLILVRDGVLPDGSGGYLPSFRLLLNNGAGVFTPAPPGFLPAVNLDPPTSMNPSFLQGNWVLLGDLDGDGDRDAIMGTDLPVENVPVPGARGKTLEILENR